MTFTGIITAVGECREVPCLKNKGVNYFRDVVVQTVEEYPHGACFSIKGDLARSFDMPQGTRVTVDFDLRAVESTKQPGQWFTSVNAWRIEPVY